MESVSKSRLKAKALEYFRQVERTGEALIITDRGKPVLKLVPFREQQASALEELRGTVLRYRDPMKPVALEDWGALKNGGDLPE